MLLSALPDKHSIEFAAESLDKKPSIDTMFSITMRDPFRHSTILAVRAGMLGLMLFVAAGAAGFVHVSAFHAHHDIDTPSDGAPVEHDHGDRHDPDGSEHVRCHVLLALSSVQAAAPPAELTLERCPVLAELTPATRALVTGRGIPELTRRGPPIL